MIPRMPEEINKQLEKNPQVINTQVNKEKVEELEHLSNYDLDESYIMNQNFNDGYLQEKSKEKSANALKAVREKKKKQKREDIAAALTTEYTAADLHELLQRQDRVVVDLKEDWSDAAEEQGGLDVTEAEIIEIDKMLSLYGQMAATGETLEDTGTIKYTVEEFQEAITSLRYKKARDVSQLLINEHSKKDSVEMAYVKMEVMRLSVHLEAIRDVAVSKEALDDIRTYYEVAIKYCEDYLSSSKKRKNARYEKVAEVWENLSYEAARLSQFKESDLGKFKTMGNLLGMSNTENVTYKRKNIDQKQPLMSDCTRESANVQGIFEEGYSFADAFKAAGTSTKAVKKLANQISSLKSAIDAFIPDNKQIDDNDAFAPDSIQIKDIDVLGNKVRILQKADNSLCVIDVATHNRVELACTAAELSRKITESMLQTPDNYADADIVALIRSYQKMYDPADPKLDDGTLTRVREDLIEYLSNKLGVTKDLFNDIRTSELLRHSTELAEKAKNVQAVKSEVEHGTKSKENINSAQLIEMMELEEIKQKQKGVAQDDNVNIYKLQAEADNSEWTEEEKSVKNLMAEMVFATDTYIMDKYSRNPEEYIRKILQDNIEAVKILVKENAQPGQDLISKIMRAMALDKVSNNKKDNFSEVISSSLKDIITHLKSLGDVDIKAVIDDTQNKAMTDKLIAASTKMDESVKTSSELMQENVNSIVDSMFAEVEAEQSGNSLTQIMKQATRTNAGQGLFIRNVLKSYFAKMSPMDQRAMLASALRSCRKVELKQFSDEDLYNDIKSRKLTKYKTLTDKAFKELTQGELNQLQEYRAEKEALQLGENYFAGLIRGAGPLLHKMLQGIPEENLPQEIRLALRDVKSKLPPIPDRVVKTMLNAMIKRSDKKITKIDVEKNLGAASVGQTFKCRIYGRGLPEEGKSVVIKLLRPDCQNRMKREEVVMLDCAKQVNPGMYETYKGQLSNHYMELDLSKESKNIDAGQIYKGKYGDVDPEVKSDIVTATTDTLMIEEAEGKTLDDILVETEKKRDEIKLSVQDTYVENGVLHYTGSTKLSLEGIEKTKKAREKLVNLANDLVKKRDIMANITKLWIEEALFGSGYYHADLHAGNILLSDKGTLIDFGNAVQFTPEQQACITKMMTAAADGSKRVNLFFEEFNKLLDYSDPKFVEFYNEEKQAEVKRVFTEILNMGSSSYAGERISAALIKASELGVKLPPAIYNFSQGQLRLQKSIDDINNQISYIQEDLIFMDRCLRGVNKYANGLNSIFDKIFSSMKEDTFESAIKQQLASYEPVDKKAFVEDLLNNKEDEGDLTKGIAAFDGRQNFDKKYLNGFENFSRQLKKGTAGFLGKQNVDYMPDFQELKQVWINHKNKWAPKLAAIKENKELSQEEKDKQLKEIYKQISADGCSLIGDVVPPNASTPIYTKLGVFPLYPEIMNSLQTLDETAMNKLFKVYDEVIPTGLELEKKIKELRNLQDDDELSDEVKTSLTDEIYELYVKFQDGLKASDPVTENFTQELSKVCYEDSCREELDMMFKETSTIIVEEEVKKEGEDKKEEKAKKKVEVQIGPYFKKKIDEYYKIAKNYAPPKGSYDVRWRMDNMPADVEKTVKELVKELSTLHLEITKRQLKAFYNGRYDKKIDIKSYRFSDVMREIILDNKGSYISKVGLGNLVSIFGSKVWDMMKSNFS